MTVEKQLFYEKLTAHIRAVDAKKMAEIIELVKSHTVTAFDTKCYVLFSATLRRIYPTMTSHSCAKLYKGWPIDSKKNPTAVAAIFRACAGSGSTSSGVVIPCSHIDGGGLEVKVRR